MALKNTIHEKCKKCGVVVARLVKDGIAWNPSACTCPKGDGPPSPPRKLSFHSANFVPDDSSIPMVTSTVQARALLAVDPKAETVELPVVPEIALTDAEVERDQLRAALAACWPRCGAKGCNSYYIFATDEPVAFCKKSGHCCESGYDGDPFRAVQESMKELLTDD